MDEKQMLELAAKAAGYEVQWHERWGCFVHVGPHNITNPPSMAGQRHVWVPLEDDGDALRLAVKLRLDIEMADDGVVAWYENFFGTGRIRYEDDPAAATRLAIVRAAAAIGEQSNG